VDGISMVNLNMGSTIPIGCFRAYTFVDRLVATTLFPILLTVLILALFCAEHALAATFIKKADPSR
jgi:fumarate reductase subunit D